MRNEVNDTGKNSLAQTYVLFFLMMSLCLAGHVAPRLYSLTAVEPVLSGYPLLSGHSVLSGRLSKSRISTPLITAVLSFI